ncbi:hypothetical protein [Alcanivorax sp. 1008]|uniref:hypothetical protein n=1 Tax=Alcanivorax sp. 1008 TaxID=2816853 RepID=UPI001E0EEFB5|nr:hypothetical protein [Alcanivorax sp. 1008]MCC1497622.1 hypothetical protein [Alcanivorax sp. 1008]
MMQDYAAPWFRARRLHGIDDTIYFGMIEPSDGKRHVFSVPHEQCDGVGAFMQLLRRIPVSDWRGVTGKSMPIPGFLQCWRAQQRKKKFEAPMWRKRALAAVDAKDQFIAVEYFSEEQTRRLRQQAKSDSVPLNAMLMAALHNVVSEQLLVQGGGGWFVPVTLRGALTLPSDEMNHASGICISLTGRTDGVAIQQQLSQAIRNNEHWWMWHQARLVATLGGQWLVNRLLPLMQQRQHLGSFSSMGEWSIDWQGSDYPLDTLMWAVPPGSPAYPVAACWLICNGRLVLMLKLNAVLGFGAERCQSLMKDWAIAIRSSLSSQFVGRNGEKCNA